MHHSLDDLTGRPIRGQPPNDCQERHLLFTAKSAKDARKGRGKIQILTCYEEIESLLRQWVCWLGYSVVSGKLPLDQNGGKHHQGNRAEGFGVVMNRCCIVEEEEMSPRVRLKRLTPFYRPGDQRYISCGRSIRLPVVRITRP